MSGASIGSTTIKTLGEAARSVGDLDAAVGRHPIAFWGRSESYVESLASRSAQLEGAVAGVRNSLPSGHGLLPDLDRAVSELHVASLPGGLGDGTRSSLRSEGHAHLRAASDALQGAYETASGRPARGSVERMLRKVSGLDKAVPAASKKPASGAGMVTATWRPAQPLPKAMEPYGEDLTAAAAQGTLDPVVGRDPEIDKVIEIITRRKNNNVALIGSPGVGKTAIAEGLAQRIVDGTAKGLENTRVWSMNIESMNSGNRGGFEGHLKQVLDAAAASNGKVIIFADEMHNLLSAGSHSAESDVGGTILKPALARGKVRMIGATTLNEFREGVERDGAFARRFQRVTVDAPDDATSQIIARRVGAQLGEDYSVHFPDEMADMASTYAARYIKSSDRPDSVVRLMTPMATAARQEARAAGVDIEAPPPTVTTAHLKSALQQITGVPVSIGEPDPARAKKFLEAEQTLGKTVFGQDTAVSSVARALRRAEAGLKPDNRPIASLAFLGPTGVGKTELTRAAADLLFENPEKLFRIDGSEFQHAGSELALTTGDKGVGRLTEYVRQNPYSVVLFDEIEKANPAMHKLLLQILDAGRLTDGKGRIVDFSNTLVVLTSNAGAREIVRAGSPEAKAQVAKASLKNLFAPELYNRIDEVVPFNALGTAELRGVAAKMAKDEVQVPLHEKHGIDISFDDEALDAIAQAGNDPEMGARPVRRAVQRNVTDPLSDAVLDGSLRKGETVTVHADASTGTDGSTPTLRFEANGKTVATKHVESVTDADA